MIKITNVTYSHDVALNIRTNSEIKDTLTQMAKRDGISVTTLVNKMIIRDLKRQGIEIKIEVEI